MKKVLSTITASLIFGALSAQTGKEAAAVSLLDDPLLPVYLTAGAVLFLLILVALVAIYVLKVLKFLTEEAMRQHSARTQVKPMGRQSWWQAFVHKMNASVPIEKEKDIELDHSYDGIRELDNHLPPWWKWLFYGTIVWGIIYFIVFHVTDSLPLSLDEYKHELALADQEVKKYQASQPKTVIDENTLEFTADATAIENGKSIFLNNNCAGCHRADGGGNTIGPNLTDEYWIHGGEAKSIYLTIKNGAVEKGMPAWGKSMSAQDVRDVTFYVMSLNGTNPPDAKAPQGEVFKQVKAIADTLKTQAGI